MPIAIVLADDHRTYREQLRALLEQQPDLTVAGEAEDGQAAVTLVQELARQGRACNLVLIDVLMPRLNGIEATRQLVSVAQGTKVIALSLHAERQWVKAMVQAGASGYILKDDPYTDLLQAIRAVVGGQTYFSRQLGLPPPGSDPRGNDPSPAP